MTKQRKCAIIGFIDDGGHPYKSENREHTFTRQWERTLFFIKRYRKMKNSPETLAKRNELKRKWRKETDLLSFPHKIEKICKDCGKLKWCNWNSSFTQTGQPEYKARCDDCQKVFLHKIRIGEKSKSLRNIRRKKGYTKRKQWAVDFLGGKCISCGYNKCLGALTFHHRNQKEKEYEIGSILDWNEELIINELNKCDLLCFNCHMELHNNGMDG